MMTSAFQLIAIVCVVLGFMTHLHSAWVSKQEYKLCESTEKVWREMKDTDCPGISLETAFLIMIVICLTSSLLWYSCEVCCIGKSKIASLIYVIYLALAATTLIIAGSLYIKSAVMISKLPTPDYMPVIENMGRVLVAAFGNKNPDSMKLVSQSDEKSYYQEKLATGFLTIINGVLHVICAWLAVIDLRR